MSRFLETLQLNVLISAYCRVTMCAGWRNDLPIYRIPLTSGFHETGLQIIIVIEISYMRQFTVLTVFHVMSKCDARRDEARMCTNTLGAPCRLPLSSRGWPLPGSYPAKRQYLHTVHRITPFAIYTAAAQTKDQLHGQFLLARSFGRRELRAGTNNILTTGRRTVWVQVARDTGVSHMTAAPAMQCE